ncbi:hypothetical protein B0H12DRAFT_1138460 [Mycena haematopus]|nr:hypothetical protein B0H12DRAFT_1138460 [Mycena haematopus]
MSQISVTVPAMTLASLAIEVAMGRDSGEPSTNNIRDNWGKTYGLSYYWRDVGDRYGDNATDASTADGTVAVVSVGIESISSVATETRLALTSEAG